MKYISCLRDGGMGVNFKVLGFIGLFLLASLACSQSGEILTPEEATARAQAPITGSDSSPSNGGSELDLSEAKFKIDEPIILVSNGSVVPLRSTAGAATAIYFAPVNQPGTVAAVTAVRDVIWYQIDSTSGLGWVTDQYLKSPVGEGEESVTEEEPSSGEESASEGPQPGDTVYLTAVGFLINLMENPGDTRFFAVQERGVAVQVLDVAEVDGQTWYFIDAPTGKGWVKAENITTEAP